MAVVRQRCNAPLWHIDNNQAATGVGVIGAGPLARLGQRRFAAFGLGIDSHWPLSDPHPRQYLRPRHGDGDNMRLGIVRPNRPCKNKKSEENG